MKTWFLSFLLLGLLTGAAWGQKLPVYGKYTWYEGLEKARSEGKSLFVYVGQKGCSYCKALDKSLEQNPDVAAFIQEKFVPVRHSTATPYGKAMAIDHRLQTTPALMVQNPALPEDPLILYGITDALTLRNALEKYLAEGKREP